MTQSENTISTTPSRWFGRGFMVGVLLIGGLTAISYFFRSDDFGNLLGGDPSRREAIGFPIEIWERGNAYNGYFVDYFALMCNLAAGSLVAAVLGWITARNTKPLNQIVARFEAEFEDRSEPFQFSIRGLLGAMVVAAVIAGLWKSTLASRPEVLGGIYLFGPLVLIATTMAPRRIPWQQRVAIIVPLTLLLIVAAVAIGAAFTKPLEADQVLMGIFVCWTPQTVAAALALTALILFVEARRNAEQLPAQDA